MMLLALRGEDVDYIMPPTFNCADHFSSAPAAFYSYLVILVFQPRNWMYTKKVDKYDRIVDK